MYNDTSIKYKKKYPELRAVNLEIYEEVLGKEEIDSILEIAEPLADKKWAHVSSTFEGGGVAEMLLSVVPIVRGLGIETEWNCIEGTDDFFSITKSLHNAIQGVKQEFTLHDLLETYIEINRNNFNGNSVEADMVLVHDPQPLPSITHGNYKGKLIWRCHIDTTEADPMIWNYLLPFINSYDGAIFTMEKFAKEGIKTPVYTIEPSIDPLSVKNRQRTEIEAKETLEPLFSKYHIDPDKPIVLAVSRYDIHKNQKSIIDAFKKAKEDSRVQKLNPQLIIVGNSASDDPEGQKMYEETVEHIDHDTDIFPLVNIENNDENIGALMRVAKLFIHISTKEGFGLVVTEAMWQGTPVIGSNVGGITLQVNDDKTGFVVEPFDIENTASKIKRILTDHELGVNLGRNGIEHVRENFLLPTLVKKYLRLMRYILEIGPPSRMM